MTFQENGETEPSIVVLEAEPYYFHKEVRYKDKERHDRDRDRDNRRDNRDRDDRDRDDNRR